MLKGTQSVSFVSSAPVGATVGIGSFTPVATSDRGLPVNISVATASSGICSISVGGVVSYLSFGSCQLQADQAGNVNYEAASQATLSFAIAKGTQTLRFDSAAPSNAQVGGTSLVFSSSSSGLTPVLTVDASASSICSVSGSVVTFSFSGTCVLNVNQPGNNAWNPAIQVQQVKLFFDPSFRN